MAFIFVLLLLLTLGFFAYRSADSLKVAIKWEKHTQEVLLRLDEMLVMVTDVETGGRGFVLTGNRSFLEPYNNSTEKINQNLSNLRRLMADHPQQLSEITNLENLINEKIDFTRELIETRSGQGLQAASNLVERGRGKQLMDEIRLSIGTMKEEEGESLAKREEELNQGIRNTLLFLAFATIAGVVSVGLANFTVVRETGKRRRAEEELRETNKNLENRVRERTLELSAANEELKEQISRRKQSEKEKEKLFEDEQAARKEAEIANRLRDEFLATVSHELRAPLSSILGWGRLLETGKLDGQAREKAIQTIIRNAEAQNHLIEDLLDVSRIISGKLRLEIADINPIDLIETALETVRPTAEAKDITLEIKETSDVGYISGDSNRLQQVIWNLVSNAIKFTPNGGNVLVKIERESNNVEIRVEDTGIGIKKEFLPYVFERFRQADASSIRKFGGLGLGLAIVRHITEMHGGTVHVHSDGENKGAVFTVKLPILNQVREERYDVLEDVQVFED